MTDQLFSMKGTGLKTGVHIEPGKRLGVDFFTKDVLEVAPALLGKILAVRQPDKIVLRQMITETEAYRGTEDKACHASRGKTPRTEVMFRRGGFVYVYFVYGMYWMLNVVTGCANEPQAVLIRGIDGSNGPGRLTRSLNINGTFYGEDMTVSERIWIEDSDIEISFEKTPRIGIGYAGRRLVNMLWIFIITSRA
ncbi:MAG: DNA-3-methyladenine glycosylase [Bacteroidales bacterium]